jgi:hypothetical protein
MPDSQSALGLYFPLNQNPSRVMGHPLSGKGWPKPDLALDLLGIFDYAHEMRLLCAEAKTSLK